MGENGEKQGEVSTRLTIRNKLGLHARAAVKFVQLASQYRCDVKVSKDGQDANGKSIMGLLTLVAACGMEIHLAAVGADAEQAVAALSALVNRGFDEGIADA